MQRLRNLSKHGNRFELDSCFEPTTDDEFFGGVNHSRCIVTFDFSRRNPISVTHPVDFDLPPLYLIAEEIDYMFHLLKSLSPYETQTSQSQDIPQI